jgi:hypothetical protein
MMQVHLQHVRMCDKAITMYHDKNTSKIHFNSTYFNNMTLKEKQTKLDCS